MNERIPEIGFGQDMFFFLIFIVKAFYVYQTQIEVRNVELIFTLHLRNVKLNEFLVIFKLKIEIFLTSSTNLMRRPWFV